MLVSGQLISIDDFKVFASSNSEFYYKMEKKNLFSFC